MSRSSRVRRTRTNKTVAATLASFAEEYGIALTLAESRYHGRQLSRWHRGRGIRIGIVPVGRNGKVHVYRSTVLKAYFRAYIDRKAARDDS